MNVCFALNKRRFCIKRTFVFLSFPHPENALSATLLYRQKIRPVRTVFRFCILSDSFRTIKVLKGLKNSGLFLHLFRIKFFWINGTAPFRTVSREGAVVYVFIGQIYFLLEVKSSLAIFHMPRKEALVISTSLS